MGKWDLLQTRAKDKDEQLNQNHQLWKEFKRQLDDLEQAAQQFSNLDNFCKSITITIHRESFLRFSISNTFFQIGCTSTIRSVSQPDARLWYEKSVFLDEFQILLKTTIESAEEFSDNSKEWIVIEHRLRAIRDKYQFLSIKTTRPQRELKTSPDMREELLSINSQLDHLESLSQSLEPIDDNEIDANVHRTKLHRYIRIHDDLEILNERLIDINDRSSSLLSNEQMRLTNDLKFLFDRLNSIKRIVRIHLDQLEKLLARTQLNSSLSLSRTSSLRASNGNLQVR